jgi:hypothetical protein
MISAKKHKTLVTIEFKLTGSKDDADNEEVIVGFYRAVTKH